VDSATATIASGATSITGAATATVGGGTSALSDVTAADCMQQVGTVVLSGAALVWQQP